MTFQDQYKCPSHKALSMAHKWGNLSQIQAVVTSVVKNAVALTAPYSEHQRQMDIALAAFWKAPFLFHTHIQFQVTLKLNSQAKST